MALSHIQIDKVRNLQEVELPELGQFNVFFGRNGSGKTSILEAIYLLGMARSFRGSSIKPLIQHGKEDCVVYGRLSRPGSAGAGIPVGVRRDVSGNVQIKIGGKPSRKVAQLVEQFPLQIITADSFGLLTGSPVGRRQYLDWGVFHVEHRFYNAWQRFQRCLKQRNKLLRRGKISDQELQVWTRDLAESGSAVNEYRQDYLKILIPRFRDIVKQLAPSLGQLELRYRQGWDKQMTYPEALENSTQVDLDQGYTHAGPQRADIRVIHDGHIAADTLSRGQQKLVVCGLKLAQGQLMSEMGRDACTYLIDDLPSELDQEHSQLVCQQLAAIDAQVFLTCVQYKDIESVWPKTADLNMFHVEQGAVKAYVAPV